VAQSSVSKNPTILASKQAAWTTEQENLSSDRLKNYLGSAVNLQPYCHYQEEDITHAHSARMKAYLADFDHVMTKGRG
jgi:hypothetical protein